MTAKKEKPWGTGKITKFPAKKVAEMMRDREPVSLYPASKVDPGIIVEDFECPICNSREYEALRKMCESRPGLIGPGNQISHVVIGYQCSGCTTQFSDPRKFTKKE